MFTNNGRTIMKIIDNQKTNCTELINLIKKEGFEVICAGGFPRDYRLNKEGIGSNIRARDLDLYVKYTDDYDKLIKKLKCDNLHVEESFSEYTKTMNGVSKIYTGTYNSKVISGGFDKFEIIFIKHDKDLKDYVFTSFDVSICMAVFDGTDFHYSDSFEETLKTKVITFNGSLDRDLIDYSFKKHMPKLAEKFKDEFTLDVSNIKAPESVFNYFPKVVKKTELAKAFHKKDIAIEFKDYLVIEGASNTSKAQIWL